MANFLVKARTYQNILKHKRIKKIKHIGNLTKMCYGDRPENQPYANKPGDDRAFHSVDKNKVWSLRRRK